MIWRISKFVELEHLADDERKQLLRDHVGPRAVAYLVARSVFLGGCGGILVTGLVQAIWLNGAYVGWVAGSAVLACIVLAYQYHIIRIRGQLITYLRKRAKEQRLPMCLRCGYSLEGLQSGVCPECGTPIDRGKPKPLSATSSHRKPAFMPTIRRERHPVRWLLGAIVANAALVAIITWGLDRSRHDFVIWLFPDNGSFSEFHSVVTCDLVLLGCVLACFERRPKMLAGLFLLGALLATVVGAAPRLVHLWQQNQRVWLPDDVVGFGFVASLFGVPLVLVVAAVLQRVVPIRLRTVNCRHCGYCLIGATSRRCPECGTAFTLEELGIAAADLDPDAARGTDTPEESTHSQAKS